MSPSPSHPSPVGTPCRPVLLVTVAKCSHRNHGPACDHDLMLTNQMWISLSASASTQAGSILFGWGHSHFLLLAYANLHQAQQNYRLSVMGSEMVTWSWDAPTLFQAPLPQFSSTLTLFRVCPSGIASLLSALGRVLASMMSQVDNHLPPWLPSLPHQCQSTANHNTQLRNSGFPLPIHITQTSMFHPQGLPAFRSISPVGPQMLYLADKMSS